VDWARHTEKVLRQRERRAQGVWGRIKGRHGWRGLLNRGIRVQFRRDRRLNKNSQFNSKNRPSAGLKWGGAMKTSTVATITNKPGPGAACALTGGVPGRPVEARTLPACCRGPPNGGKRQPISRRPGSGRRTRCDRAWTGSDGKCNYRSDQESGRNGVNRRNDQCLRYGNAATVKIEKTKKGDGFRLGSRNPLSLIAGLKKDNWGGVDFSAWVTRKMWNDLIRVESAGSRGAFDMRVSKDDLIRRVKRNKS